MKLKITEIAYKIYPKLKNNYPRYKYGTTPPPPPQKKRKAHRKGKNEDVTVSFVGCMRKVHYTVCSPTLLERQRSTIGWRDTKQ